MYSRLISYPGGPNCGPSGVSPIVLIALKPYLMFTVNIAPSIEKISGTLRMATNAPTRSARPQNISSKVTSQAFARGHGTPTCLRSSAKVAGPRLHLAHPWTMNPTPRIIRIGIGAQLRHRSSFTTSRMGIPFELDQPEGLDADHFRGLGPLPAAHVQLGMVEAKRLDLDDDVIGLRLRSWNLLVHEAVSPRTSPRRLHASPSSRRSVYIQGARKSRIVPVISRACVSNAKWPVSKKRTTALGMSRLNASAPDGRKNGSFLPHTARSGGRCVRKYSWNFGYSATLLA